jgi:hypothetical protein
MAKPAKGKQKGQSKKMAVTKKLKKVLSRFSLGRLQKHYGFITKLATASSKSLKSVKKMLKNATSGEILVLAEIVLNLLRKNIPLSVKQKRILCPFRNKLREIASKKSNCDKKRTIFSNQRGGILGIIGAILSAAIPAISSLFSSLTSQS